MQILVTPYMTASMTTKSITSVWPCSAVQQLVCIVSENNIGVDALVLAVAAC